MNIPTSTGEAGAAGPLPAPTGVGGYRPRMADTYGDARSPIELGFAQVDLNPQAAALVAGMEATAGWPAVRELRRWERRQLALGPGDRLLDVGCGIGDVSLALAADVDPGGEVVGVDASEVMLAAAGRRLLADPPEVPVTFRRGDALDLDEPDGSFSAVRSERVVQWLPEAADGVAEMVRVLAPGGSLSLIDTDWRTFAFDLDGSPDAAAVNAAMLRVRGVGALAGGRLLNLCRAAGLVDLRCTGAVQVWTEWDPDTEPGPVGLFPVREVIPHVAQAGGLDPAVAERALETLIECGRQGRFFASLTLFAVCGRRADRTVT
jgi:SAM-dependent methyltransferase